MRQRVADCFALVRDVAHTVKFALAQDSRVRKRRALRERIANQEAEFVRKTKAMKTKEQELHNTIGKLLNVEEAFDSAFTCLHCFNLFDNPVTCIPCNHSYCQGCVDKLKKSNTRGDGKWCTECANGGFVEATVRNELLDQLVGKFIYKKQALAALKDMTLVN